jgi:hypothetical protein
MLTQVIVAQVCIPRMKLPAHFGSTMSFNNGTVAPAVGQSAAFGRKRTHKVYVAQAKACRKPCNRSKQENTDRQRFHFSCVLLATRKTKRFVRGAAPTAFIGDVK